MEVHVLHLVIYLVVPVKLDIVEQTVDKVIKIFFLNSNYFYILLIDYLKGSNACSNSPCLNSGTCQPTGTGSTYSCVCPSSYSGTNCQLCNILKN